MATWSSKWRLCLLFALFLAPLYGWFYQHEGAVFSSPDERAVSVFAEYWAQNNTFLMPRTVINDAVLPRSVAAHGADFAPTGFLGLFLLLGLAWRLVGSFGFFALVPILAALTPVAAFTLWRRIFSERVALIASVLLGLFPAWAYYASRGLLPNVAFVSLVVISLALFAKGLDAETKRGQVYLGAAGLALGLGLMVRPIESLWLIPLLAVLWWWQGRPIKVALSIPTLLIPLFWLAYWQAATYGAWYLVGYTASGAVGQGVSASASVWKTILAAWFPFGFHPVLALQRLSQYSLVLYWWIMPFAVIGFFQASKKSNKISAHKKYSCVFIWVLTFLVFYYGSWAITDHPSLNWVTIGVAYNRYWLPAFVMMMPLVAEGVFAFARRWPKRAMLGSLVLALSLFASVATTFVLGADSLWAMASHGVEYKQLQDWLVAQTPATAVVVAGREEKFVWPKREVLFASDGSFDFVERLPSLAAKQPVYWLTDLPVSHVADVEQRLFTRVGMHITVAATYGSYKLYLIGF